MVSMPLQLWIFGLHSLLGATFLIQPVSQLLNIGVFLTFQVQGFGQGTRRFCFLVPHLQLNQTSVLGHWFL